MIISASRRTEIPAFYSKWFFNRIKDGYVLVRNPMKPSAVSRINLSPDVVDGIVLWSKNPKPMIAELYKLKDYPYYFQFTLNPYGTDVEEHLPPKEEIIDTFKELSDKIGPSRVIWRYDPVIINDKYTVKSHIESFSEIARKLRGYTQNCIISFVDYYKSIAGRIWELRLRDISDMDMRFIAKHFSAAAKENGLKLETCAEEAELSEFGVGHAKCIDSAMFTKITGCSYNYEKDKNQRPECGCIASIDIGAYNTCTNGCKYCYANHSMKLVKENNAQYDEDSPLLCGKLNEEDKVTDREMKSFKNGQLGFDFI